MAHNPVRDLIYSYFPNSKKYLTYGKGNSNIILTAPHGGDIKPISIRNRTYGNRGKDSYTRRLIQKVIDILTEKPYYIYSDIHRAKVDLNRDIEEAAQGNAKAEKVWFDWNDIISSYQKEIRGVYDNGLLVDIHSHGINKYIQIGYGLSAKEYLDVKSGKNINDKSTLRSLGNSDYEFPMLFGEGSFPHTMEQFGYEVFIPSNEKEYLSGGRNIRQYSMYKMGAVQIESPIPLLRDDLDGVAIAIANSIEIFRERFM